MAVTPYSNTGHNELSTTSPAGTDPLNEGDDHLRKIQAFLKDSTSGLGKLLGSLGQNKTVQKGTGALSTPSDNEHCHFYFDTSNNNLYFALDGVAYPLLPIRGAVAGKVLTSAGTDTLPTWSNAIPRRGVLECVTTGVAGNDKQMQLVASGALPTGVSIVTGFLRVATGYSVVIRGFVDAFYSQDGYYELYNITAGSVLQTSTGRETAGYNITGYFDVAYTNSTGGNVDIKLQSQTNAAAVPYTVTSISTVRLVVEVYPN